MLADAGRVQQVLSNLIGNAIKFTPHGGRITVRGEPGAGEVRIAVTDTGAGIAAENIPHVFGQYWLMVLVDPQTAADDLANRPAQTRPETQ